MNGALFDAGDKPVTLPSEITVWPGGAACYNNYSISTLYIKISNMHNAWYLTTGI
jgi:hypothetical protein